MEVVAIIILGVLGIVICEEVGRGFLAYLAHRREIASQTDLNQPEDRLLETMPEWLDPRKDQCACHQKWEDGHRDRIMADYSLNPCPWYVPHPAVQKGDSDE